MDSNRQTTSKGQDLPEQWFNGKRYKLYNGERYFSRGTKRLHRVVWEFHKGEIPEGYDIHHVDGNSFNNEIENLNLVKSSLHQRMEGKKRFKENPEFARSFQSKGIEKAKEWHSSEEGKRWHSEHGRKTWVNRERFRKNCEQCGNEYETHFPERSKYCHNNCKAKALRARRNRELNGL